MFNWTFINSFYVSDCYSFLSKALKRFREVGYDVGSQFIKKINEEVEVLKKINEKNIIGYIDYFEEKTEMVVIRYLVTKYYDVII